MAWDDDAKSDEVLHRDDNVLSFLRDLVAADDPLELFSGPLPPAIVSDLGTHERPQVFDDKPPLFVEGQTKVAPGYASAVHNDVAAFA